MILNNNSQVVGSIIILNDNSQVVRANYGRFSLEVKFSSTFCFVTDSVGQINQPIKIQLVKSTNQLLNDQIKINKMSSFPSTPILALSVEMMFKQIASRQKSLRTMRIRCATAAATRAGASTASSTRRRRFSTGAAQTCQDAPFK